MSGESGQLVFVTACPTGIQLRMERLQRSGCLRCAPCYTSWRWASTFPSRPKWRSPVLQRTEEGLGESVVIRDARAAEGRRPPTCEANDVNPEAYLADVLLRVQTHPHARIGELLPHGWKRLRAADSS